MMSDTTGGLQSGGQNDSQAAEEILPLVYEELRQLAKGRIAMEAPGPTLQATALVHDAWIRLVGGGKIQFANRSHFFACAAEAMRRILIEQARRRQVLARGGFSAREEITESKLVVLAPDDELLAIHEALDQLASEDPAAASLVKLRYFVGMSMPEAADAMGLPLRNAERLWTFAKAWLRCALRK